MKNTSNKITTKICNNKDCQKEKPLSEFFKTKTNSDGYANVCKYCDSIRRVAEARTKDGVVSQLYSSQKTSSISRGHTLPKYTKLELREWLFNQPIFHELYDKWVDSGYEKMLRPSCDRHSETELNYDKLPYSFNRLRVVTWRENQKKSHLDVKSGRLYRKKIYLKPVFKFGLDGKFIAYYQSLKEAERATKIDPSDISRCCRLIKLSAGGYQWRFLSFEEIDIPKDISSRYKVVQLSLSGNFIQEFDSMKEASLKTNSIKTGISACCRKVRKTTNNFRWIKSNEYFAENK